MRLCSSLACSGRCSYVACPRKLDTLRDRGSCLQIPEIPVNLQDEFRAMQTENMIKLEVVTSRNTGEGGQQRYVGECHDPRREVEANGAALETPPSSSLGRRMAQWLGHCFYCRSIKRPDVACKHMMSACPRIAIVNGPRIAIAKGKLTSYACNLHQHD